MRTIKPDRSLCTWWVEIQADLKQQMEREREEKRATVKGGRAKN